MSDYSKIAVYEILLRGDKFGEKVFDPSGKINGGNPFVVYTDTVKAFMEEVKNTPLEFNNILEAAEEGGRCGVAQKDTVFALVKSIVDSEKFSEGVVLERLRDGTVQELLKKL